MACYAYLSIKEERSMGLDYKNAGVDVKAGYEAVKLMREHVQSTFRKEALTVLEVSADFFRWELLKIWKNLYLFQALTA